MSIMNTAVCAGLCLVIVGCQDLNQPLPAGTVDPNTFRTPGGAMSAYRGTLMRTAGGVGQYVLGSAAFTDEMQSESARNVTAYAGAIPVSLDARNITSDFTGIQGLFTALQVIRANADQSIGLLRLFPNEFPSSLQAELFASKAFAIALLGEFFCSGVPLSTVDFDKDFTYVPGSSTSELFTKAIQLFDSAASIGADSSRLVQFANIGAARALLNLGQFEEAAARVNHVEIGFSYGLPLQGVVPVVDALFAATMADREGGTGMPFLSSKDPRSSARFGKVLSGDSLFYSNKYFAQGTIAKLTLASYIEAVLIQAEAALHRGDTQWLSLLNALRTNNTYTINLAGDTVWAAGSGSVNGLKPLKDPALLPLPSGKTIFDVRVDLLFAERAFWLYLDGHRQGDLRRMVRQYDRDPDSVYPSGFYGPMGQVLNVRYGGDVTAPVPKGESSLNPFYHGCLNRGA